MYSTIYWLTRLDSIHGFLEGLIFLCGMVVLLSFVFTPLLSNMDSEIFTPKTLKRTLKGSFVVGMLAGILLVFVPTKNDMLLIYAGGKAYEYVQSDTSLQKMPYKATEYLKVILEKEIQEVKDKAKE